MEILIYVMNLFDKQNLLVHYIAKFQLGWKAKKDEINHLTLDSLKQIVESCNYYDIEFMASIFNEEAFELSKKLIKKI